MSVHASCPRCGQQVAVANLAPGFATLCAHCGAQFVPIAAGRAAISAFVPVPAVVPIPVVPGERIGWPIRAHDDDDAPTAPQALRFTPWLASVVVHAFAIVSLGILVTPGMASREGVSLLASVAPEELPIDEAPVELDRVVQPALQTNLAAPAAMLAPALPASISTGPVRVAPGTALKA